MTICFTLVPITPTQTPSGSLCITATVTGTPTSVTLFGEPLSLRVTELN